MFVHQLLLNNTLLSRVSNKLLIVLFDEVVYTLYIVLREGSTIVSFLVYSVQLIK